MDAHQARGWVIRDNVIEGFWCEDGLSEHGIHMWRGRRDTSIERNLLVDNARGIGLGLATGGDGRIYPDNPCPGADGGYLDHYDGVIRNNSVSLRYSGSHITGADWAGAPLITDTLPGTVQSFTMVLPYASGRLYCALKSQSAGGDWSALSNNAIWPTRKTYLPIITRGG